MTHRERIDMKSLALDGLSEARGKLMAGRNPQEAIEEALFYCRQLGEDDPGGFYLDA